MLTSEYFEQVLSLDDIKELSNYFYDDDLDGERIDRRPDVCSKHPRWNQDRWPQSICDKLLRQLLDYDFVVDEVIFHELRISYRLHVDSADGNLDRLGHVVIIPLEVDGPSSTVLFDNFWHGPSTKFSQVPIPPYEYWLPNRHGQWIYISDLRELLEDLQSGNHDPNFDRTEQFVSEIKYLIDARDNKSISKVDNRCYNYSEIINYKKDQNFDIDLHHRYLRHIPIENLHGLTVSKIYDWKPGDCFVFDRTQLHCGGYGHTRKLGITVFANRSN